MPIFAELGNLFLRTPSNVTTFGYLPVMFICLGSALWVFIVSLLTQPPSPMATNTSASIQSRRL